MNWFKRVTHLNDPRVEWRLWESGSRSGSTQWNWRAAVGDKTEAGWHITQDAAYEDLVGAVRRLLGQGVNEGRTTPCRICDRPSEFGKDTCSEECARLLKAARAEISYQTPDVRW